MGVKLNFSLESVRKNHCPLIDIAMKEFGSSGHFHENFGDPAPESDEKSSKEVERLKKLNSALYSQLVQSAQKKKQIELKKKAEN